MKPHQSTGVFIPKNGEFVEVVEEFEELSLNGISYHLGYHPDQLHHFSNLNLQSSIFNISVEIFTKNIVFILINRTEKKLEKKEVDKYMATFDDNREYTAYSIKSFLENGIESKSLNIAFLSRVLEIDDPESDGMYFVPKLEMNLFFIDGILVGAESSDGLNEWAKHWQNLNPDFFSSYEKEARVFWGNQIGYIIREINFQANAFASIPNAINNEFVSLHINDFGNINFAMLKVCHYDHSIDLKQFKQINHGRLEEVQDNKFRVQNFIYEFDEEGQLINHFSI